MELLVKPEMLTSYIYGPTFGNAEISESGECCFKVALWTVTFVFSVIVRTNVNENGHICTVSAPCPSPLQ